MIWVKGTRPEAGRKAKRADREVGRSSTRFGSLCRHAFSESLLLIYIYNMLGNFGERREESSFYIISVWRLYCY